MRGMCPGGKSCSRKNSWAFSIERYTARSQFLPTNVGMWANHANHNKSTLQAIMSQELRTPLNPTIGFSHVLRGDPTHTV